MELSGAWDLPKGSDAEKGDSIQRSRICILCETKLFAAELRRVASRFGFDCCFGVDCDVSGGGVEVI